MTAALLILVFLLLVIRMRNISLPWRIDNGKRTLVSGHIGVARQRKARLPAISAWRSARTLWTGRATYEELLREGSREYGNIFAVKDPFFSRRIVVADPVALKHIQIKHAHNYPKSQHARNILRFQFGNGLILHEDPQHDRQRRKLFPLLSARSVAALEPVMNKAAEITLKNLSEGMKDNESIRVDAVDLAGEMSARSTMLGLFKSDLALPNLDALTLFQRMSEVFRLVWVSQAVRLAVVLPFSNILRTKAQRTAIECREYVHDLMRRIIFGEKKDGGEDSSDAQRGDTIYARLKPVCRDDAELVRQSCMVMAGAIDTTAAAVSWALLELARSPQWQEKLSEELEESNGDLTRTPLLNAFIRETLRLHSSIPLTSRQSLQDDVIPLGEPASIDGKMSRFLPVRAGETLIIPYDVMNISEERWGADALQFRPERWLDSAPESADAPLSTFSEGPMSCPGFRFADKSMKVQLRAILSHFTLEDAPKDVTWSSNVVRRPCVRGSQETFAGLPLTFRRKGSS